MSKTTEAIDALEARIDVVEARKDEEDQSFAAWDRAEREYLQGVVARLRDGQSCEDALTQLKSDLPQLEAVVEREDYSPTFNWYDDHYYAKIYGGQLSACKHALAVLGGGRSTQA